MNEYLLGRAFYVLRFGTQSLMKKQPGGFSWLYVYYISY